jgi:hypothetical protein
MDAQKLREMYVERGMTLQEIADEFGTSATRIGRTMARLEIPRRRTGARNQSGERNPVWRGGRIVVRGYVMVKCPGHPRATELGQYVQEHVLVIERHLGRYLVWKGSGHPETEIVHHKDDDPQNNVLSNLELTTYAEHLEKHRDPVTGQNAGHRKAA